MTETKPGLYWQFSDDPLAVPIESIGKHAVPLDLPMSGKGKAPRRPHWMVRIEPDGQEWLAKNARGNNKKDFVATVAGFTFWTGVTVKCSTLEEAQFEGLKARRSSVAITLESDKHGGKTKPDGFGWVIAQLEKRQLSDEDLAEERDAWGVWTWRHGFYLPSWRWAIDFRGRAGIPTFSDRGEQFLGLVCFQCEELMTPGRDHPGQRTGTLLVRF